MKELKPIEETWNKKRILLGFIFLIILIAGLASFKTLVLDKSQNTSQDFVAEDFKAVKGVTTATNSPVPNNSGDLGTDIQDQLNAIQQEASSINLAEIASSSPQVQKVIDDIKAIQNLPKDKAKNLCEQICSGI